MLLCGLRKSPSARMDKTETHLIYCPPSSQSTQLPAQGLEEEGLWCFKGWFVILSDALLTTDLLKFPTQAHIPGSPPHTSSYSGHSWSLICVPETALTFAKELRGGEGGKKPHKKSFISH